MKAVHMIDIHLPVQFKLNFTNVIHPRVKTL